METKKVKKVETKKSENLFYKKVKKVEIKKMKKSEKTIFSFHTVSSFNLFNSYCNSKFPVSNFSASISL